MKTVRKSSLVLVMMLSFGSYLFGAQATIIRNTTLRSDPSSSHPPILHLSPREEVELLDSAQTNGYFHVRTADGQEGWIYHRNVIVVQDSGSSGGTAGNGMPASSDSAGGPANDASVATAIPSNWDKPSPNETQFQSTEGTCGPTGDGGDTKTNGRKNRTDVPPSYHLVTWKAFQSLPFPTAKMSLASWTPQQLAIIQPYEGIPVSVVGYLVAIKVEDRGNGESTNCHFTNPEDVDWHMPLAEQSGQAEATSIVVETTPRIRQSHSKWTTTSLAPWVNSDSPVRISGWALLDPEHRAQLGRYRSTLWEVHPVTKIEVFSNGQWVDLDQLGQ